MVYNVERNSHPSLFSFKYMYKKYMFVDEQKDS